MIEILRGSLWGFSITLRISPNITFKAQHPLPRERRFCDDIHGVASQLPQGLTCHFVFSLLSPFQWRQEKISSFSRTAPYSLSSAEACFVLLYFLPFLLFLVFCLPRVPSPFISHFLHIDLNGWDSSYTSFCLSHQQSFLGLKPTLVPVELSAPNSLPILGNESCVSQWKLWVDTDQLLMEWPIRCEWWWVRVWSQMSSFLATALPE